MTTPTDREEERRRIIRGRNNMLALVLGGMALLQRQIPYRAAMGMLLTGRRIPAREALELFPKRFDEYDMLLTGNRIWHDRNKGVAVIIEQLDSSLGVQAERQMKVVSLKKNVRAAESRNRKIPEHPNHAIRG